MFRRDARPVRLFKYRIASKIKRTEGGEEKAL